MDDRDLAAGACPWCLEDIVAGARVCKSCHAYKHRNRWRRPGDDLRDIRQNTVVVALLALLILIGAVVTIISSSTSTSAPRPPASLCRELPSLDGC